MLRPQVGGFLAQAEQQLELRAGLLHGARRQRVPGQDHDALVERGVRGHLTRALAGRGRPLRHVQRPAQRAEPLRLPWRGSHDPPGREPGPLYGQRLPHLVEVLHVGPRRPPYAYAVVRQEFEGPR